MTDHPQHLSVLLHEAVAGLNIQPDGCYVDATFGRGGHSRAILDQLNSAKGKGRLIGIDRDLAAAAHAKMHFANESRFHFCHGAMSQMAEHLAELGINGIDGVLMDIGVSSPQLDEAERGFSFMQDGPLDMRMDQTHPLSAKEWVMETPLEEMITTFKVYGEERFATRIARKIVAAREEQVIDTTFKLVALIREAIPFEDPHKHPATRVFQAIRIAVNEELSELEKSLEASLTLLNRGGRLVVITFHSLEDRIVKNFIKQESEVKDLYPELPILIEGEPPKLKRIGRAIKASKEEQQQNIRARSARLRVAERL